VNRAIKVPEEMFCETHFLPYLWRQVDAAARMGADTITVDTLVFYSLLARAQRKEAGQ
jgi:hypothetical protein